jgi:bacterial/archaeal transporter family-2 protein
VLCYLPFAFAAGVVLPFQAGINAELAGWLHSPLRTAFVSFLVGTLVLLVAAVLVTRPLPSANRLGAAPWWVWVGGALGAFYVAARS